MKMKLMLGAMLVSTMPISCAVKPMVRMEPTPAANQDVRFKNSTPIVYSRGPRFDVVVSPKAGPTGRYELTDRLAFMVGVHNHSDRRIEVSEANISATGNQSPLRMLRAVEIEDSVITDASWAQFRNTVDRAIQAFGPRMQGSHSW